VSGVWVSGVLAKWEVSGTPARCLGQLRHPFRTSSLVSDLLQLHSPSAYYLVYLKFRNEEQMLLVLEIKVKEFYLGEKYNFFSQNRLVD